MWTLIKKARSPDFENGCPEFFQTIHLDRNGTPLEVECVDNVTLHHGTTTIKRFGDCFYSSLLTISACFIQNFLVISPEITDDYWVFGDN